MDETLRLQRNDRRRTQAHQQTAQEKRFYDQCPRYEEHVRRVCAKSVIVYRSDIAEALTLELSDLEQAYKSARTAAAEVGRPLADMEARFGAAITLVHLQVLAKVNELLALAEAGTQVSDVSRLAQNLRPLAEMLADIEARSSIAVTGDLNEEERNKIRYFDSQRFVDVASAMQLRREAQAAVRRLNDGIADRDSADPQKRSEGLALIERAEQRLNEIRTDAAALRQRGNADREVALDRSLKGVEDLLPAAPSR